MGNFFLLSAHRDYRRCHVAAILEAFHFAFQIVLTASEAARVSLQRAHVQFHPTIQTLQNQTTPSCHHHFQLSYMDLPQMESVYAVDFLCQQWDVELQMGRDKKGIYFFTRKTFLIHSRFKLQIQRQRREATSRSVCYSFSKMIITAAQ